MISINNVSKSYNGNQAISRLTLSVNEGEIYGLLGPNGAGKSTTLNMLLGFLTPDEGQMTVNGINIIDQSVEARKNIGYIPENVSLYPYLTGLENIEYFCKLAGLSYGQTDLASFLSYCGLQAEAHNRRASSYSKGMKQKVGIAIAYAKKTKTYLFDEPASGLDPLANNELSSLLKMLADSGACVLMTSHDIFRVRETCNRIGILKHGILVKEMAISDVTINDLEKIYLDAIRDQF